MANQKEAGGAKLSTSDVRAILVKLAKKKRSQDKILVKNAEVQSMLKIHKDIDVNSETIRNAGFRHKGYFEKKYPDSCDYNYQGNTNYRGLIIKPEKFLEDTGVIKGDSEDDK